MGKNRGRKRLLAALLICAALGFLSSPAILVVLAGVTGWLLSLLRPGKEGGEAP